MTRSEKEKMLAGELYVADCPELAADNRRICQWMDRYNSTQTRTQAQRQALLEEVFAYVGAGANIRPLSTAIMDTTSASGAVPSSISTV